MADVNVNSIANLLKAVLDIAADDALMEAFLQSDELSDETKKQIRALREATQKKWDDLG